MLFYFLGPALYSPGKANLGALFALSDRAIFTTNSVNELIMAQ